MARLTHLIRDVVVEAFEKGVASATLRDLRDAFAEVLIPDLSATDFADMFAQTLSYGLFAARVEHDPSRGPFRRQDAAREIPRTNPFLRRLFATIAGPDLDDEPFVGLVDDLAQLLASTDMPSILADFGKREARTDPVMYFYETFLAAYDPALREMRGVYYTPEPVVSYIVRSVDHLLRTRFNCPDGLADTSTTSYTHTGDDGKPRQVEGPRVLILDPACGTGTFLYAVADLIRGEFIREGNAGRWTRYVRETLLPRLFGFELLMAPYAMAHLKLGMELAAKDLPESLRPDWAYDFAIGERLGIYLTNTLEQAFRQTQVLLGQFISEEANAAAEIKREKPIMVVLGNPPYSGHSANRSELERTVQPRQPFVVYVPDDPRRWVSRIAKRHRKVKEPTFIGRLLRDYYEVDGQPLKERNPKWLQDDYVKFIRFGQWRIQQTGQGILAFITNHGYLDNPTFRGMRQQLMNAFTDIYILDLHGSAKKREMTPDRGKDENVFDIKQGVAIGIFVKEPGSAGPAKVHHAHLWGIRGDWPNPQPGTKYYALAETDITSTDWAELRPSSPFYLFVPRDEGLLAEYEQGWRISEIFPINSVGIVTSRDDFVLDFNERTLRERIAAFGGMAISDEEMRQRFHLKDKTGWTIAEARKAIRQDKNWQDSFSQCLYRPFDIRPLFYHDSVIERTRREVMRHMLNPENKGLHICRQVISDSWRHALVTNRITDDSYVSNLSRERGYSIPLYLYPALEDGHNKQADMAGLLPWPEGKDGRRPNLSPEFVADVEQRLGLAFVSDEQGDLRETFGSEDVFHYIYGVLHSPTYRQRYAEFLKMDFPRVPPTSNLDLFRVLVDKGRELVALHLLESPAVRQRITRYPVPGDNLVEPGHPRYLAPGEPEPSTGKPLQQGRVYINKDNPKTGKRGQYIEGVPFEVWEFQFGGYQVCEKWLKDRRGRALTNADLEHYERVVVALKETIRLMAEIDDVIEGHGGWPLR
jgi:predicted helicase